VGVMAAVWVTLRSKRKASRLRVLVTHLLQLEAQPLQVRLSGDTQRTVHAHVASSHADGRSSVSVRIVPRSAALHVQQHHVCHPARPRFSGPLPRCRRRRRRRLGAPLPAARRATGLRTSDVHARARSGHAHGDAAWVAAGVAIRRRGAHGRRLSKGTVRGVLAQFSTPRFSRRARSVDDPSWSRAPRASYSLQAAGLGPLTLPHLAGDVVLDLPPAGAGGAIPRVHQPHFGKARVLLARSAAPLPPPRSDTASAPRVH
jgi:hypothetical protein